MTTERSWLGVTLVVIGAFFLIQAFGLGLPLMRHWFGFSPSILHIVGGPPPFVSGFPHYMIRSVIQTVVPLLLVGLGVYLVLRTR
ncbi:MAG TPA: hypothetical protein VM118_06115 [Acidobacteriota bacterium]|nr:hypothetical protein [Acidobacteriota bacterium]